MIKQLSLLTLCALAMSGHIQPMNYQATKKILIGVTASALTYYALKQGYQWWQLWLLKQELARNPLALHNACKHGNLKKVQALLAAGALINYKGYEGWRPLHIASYGGRKDIVDLLLKHGADVNIQDDANWTALHNASYKGHYKIAQCLIEHKALINNQDTAGWTPLHRASFEGHEKIVKLLLRYDACVNSRNNDGHTPLHWASYQGYNEIVRMLVCSYSYQPAPSAEVSLPERCMIILLKNLDKIGKKELILQLAHFWTVDDSTASMVAHRVPIKLQRSLINLLQQCITFRHNSRWWQVKPCMQELTGNRPSFIPTSLVNLLQDKKAREALRLLLKAHCDHYFNMLQEVLAIKDSNNKTARDMAFMNNHHEIVALFDHLTQAKDFYQLNEDLKKSILATLQEKLSIEPSGS